MSLTPLLRDRVRRATLLSLMLVPLGIGPGPGSIRFRWEKGDTFSYRLEGRVQEGEAASTLDGEVILRALSPTAAILDRRLSRLVRTEGDDQRLATPGELAAMRVLVPLGPRGEVPEEAGLDEKEAESVRGFTASLFPLPPEEGPATEEGWEIRIPTPGDLLTGRGRLGRTVDVEGTACVEIRFQASSPGTRKEVEGTAYFSRDLGAFVRVEREIRSPGPPERRETLTLHLRRHPSGPVLDPAYRRRIDLAREAVGRDPENAAAWAALSRVLREGGAAEEALEAIRKATARDPKALDYRTEEGEILGLLGRLEEAVALLAGVVERDPDRNVARLHLARIHFQRGLYDEAGVHAAEALERDADLTDARFLLGLVRAKQGKRDEAVRLIRSCYPAREGTEPPVVTFDRKGNLRLVLPGTGGGPAERPPLTAEEREVASKIIEAIVQEEARRQGMKEEEVDRVLEYVAAACGTDPLGLIAEFLSDRDGTSGRIARSLQAKSEIPLKDVRALLSSDDADYRLGAAFFLPIDEAIAAVHRWIQEDPTRPEPYLHLAAIILREEGGAIAHRDDLLRALRTGKELDSKNAIYGYLLASIYLDQGQTILAVEAMTEAINRSEVSTLRAREARLRRKVLTKVGFDPVFRGPAAWGDSETPFAEHLLRAADGMMAFATLIEEEGKAADARSFLESVLLIAAQVRDKADEVRLIRATGSFEAAALKALVDLDRRMGDEEAAGIHGKWKEAAAKEEALRARAEEAFLAERDAALRLWPITNPARARAYLREALAGERRIFERFLEEVRRSPGGGR